jgi:hypothetical protein
LVDRHSRFLQNSFEMGPVAACHFSKEICANSRNLSTNRKMGMMLGSFGKFLGNSKAFGVKNS